MRQHPKTGVKLGRLFYRMKKLEYRIEKGRTRLKRTVALKNSFSDKKVLRLNRRLVKLCVRLSEEKEAYSGLLRKARETDVS